MNGEVLICYYQEQMAVHLLVPHKLELGKITNATHHWGLWGGDTETLRQDTGVVGGARTVPQ